MGVGGGVGVVGWVGRALETLFGSGSKKSFRKKMKKVLNRAAGQRRSINTSVVVMARRLKRLFVLVLSPERGTCIEASHHNITGTLLSLEEETP